MSKEKLVGCWHLSSWTTLSNGRRTDYFGAEPTGQILYTAEGFMSAQIMTAGRGRMGMPPAAARTMALQMIKPWRAPSALRGLGAVLTYLKESINYMAYCGTWEIRGDKIVHHISASLIPDWVGVDRVRQWTLSDDGERLRLRVPLDEASGDHILEWVRAG